MPATYELISNVQLGSNASTISISGIPQTYKDIVVRWSVRIVSGNPLNGFTLRFNSDSSAIYSSRFYAYDGGLYFNYDTGSGAFASPVVNGGSSIANTFTFGEFYIPDYASTSNKVFSYQEAAPNNSTSARVVHAAGRYNNSTGITSVNFSNATFAAGSSLYIYGIKNS
jgi:hypothetical protein